MQSIKGDQSGSSSPNLLLLLILLGSTLLGKESTGVLKKAESEYKGHRSLLMRTPNLLVEISDYWCTPFSYFGVFNISTMQRQDAIDRVILAVGYFLFSCAVLYVVSKRIGILTLQRKVAAALKAGMAGKGERGPKAIEDGLNLAQVYENAVPKLDVPLERAIHDEL